MNPDPEAKYGIEQIPQMVLDPDVKNVIREMQEKVLRALGLDKKSTIEITEICLSLAEDCESITKYEHLAHHVLNRGGALDEVTRKLIDRARQICDQIQPHLLFPGRTLDYGCGNGEVGRLLSEHGFPVNLTDVKDVRTREDVHLRSLPFKPLRNGDPLPYSDNSFDNTLLLTVLHHSNHPDRLLEEAYRVTNHKGRVLVIESIIGVNKNSMPTKQKKLVKSFLELDGDQQQLVNIYFDHLFNRILHHSDDPENKINVPCNYDSPNGWKARFEQVGLKEKKVIHLGVDQPSVPEYHTLHVLEVNKSGDEKATVKA